MAAISATRQLNDLIPICARLASRDVDELVGAAKVLGNAGGRLSHREFAFALSYDDDEHTVGVTEFLGHLGIVDVSEKDVALTSVGTRIARAGISTRRRLFSELVRRLPIFGRILETLADQPDRAMARSELLDELGASSCAADADLVFVHLVAWGRYAGLFSYDDSTGMVSLT